MNEELERAMLKMATESGVSENIASILMKLSKHTSLAKICANNAVVRNGGFERMEFALTQMITHAQIAIETLADFRKAVAEEEAEK